MKKSNNSETDIANPKQTLGAQKTIIQMNGPKKRMNRKLWTKLKSGLFGWRIVTEANTQTSDVAIPKKTKTLSPTNNVTQNNCPNKSVNILSKWLLTAEHTR